MQLLSQVPVDEYTLTFTHGIIKRKRLNGKRTNGAVFVPKRLYSPLLKQEKELFYNSVLNDTISERLGLINIPDDIIKNYRIDAIREKCRTSSCKDIYSLVSLAAEAIADYCEAYKTTNEPQIILGLNVSKGSTIASTIDQETSSYVGLHLDTWYKVAIDERLVSRRRICFNLGYEDRYLVFCDVPITKMRAACGDQISNNVEEIIHLYLRSHPHTNIYRLRIKPFEGYLFSSEAYIHDGQASKKNQLDISFTLMSYYNIS